MQEPLPSYIPPGAFTGDPPMYSPSGPVGQFIDASSEAHVTIGQLAQSEFPPVHGWMVLGEGNYAYPFYGIPGQPPPGAIAAMMASSLVEAEFMTALLLMMF